MTDVDRRQQDPSEQQHAQHRCVQRCAAHECEAETEQGGADDDGELARLGDVEFGGVAQEGLIVLVFAGPHPVHVERNTPYPWQQGKGGEGAAAEGIGHKDLDVRLHGRHLLPVEHVKVDGT
ncbi:hypothetical protein D9M72_413250 [compost metagenome]